MADSRPWEGVIMDRGVTPRRDALFKWIFADPDDTAALGQLLAAVLRVPAQQLGTVTVVDPVVPPRFAEGKQIAYDVHVVTSDGRHIDVEMQVLLLKGFRERLVYYAARMLVASLRRGQGYDRLTTAVTVAITAFRLLEADGYRHRFVMYDPDGRVGLTDVLQVIVLELPKLPKQAQDDDLWHWLRFIGAESREEFEMALADPVVAAAVPKARQFTDEEIEEWVKAREFITYTDSLTLGRMQGRVEGKAEGQAELIQAMVASGLSVKRVAAIAGLSVDDVQAIVDGQDSA